MFRFKIVFYHNGISEYAEDKAIEEIWADTLQDALFILEQNYPAAIILRAERM